MSSDSKQSQLIPLLLVIILIMSAFSVSYSVHSTRKMTHESQQLQREQNALHTEWGKLLLEHSTLGSYTRVEHIARQELNMVQPSRKERVVVKP